MKLSEIVARAIGPRPLTAVARRSVVDGIERCYREAGVPWHGRVVWTPSPSATAVAAALRADAPPKPVTWRQRRHRAVDRPGGPDRPDSPDRTWDRIEARIRGTWRLAPFPLGEPGVVLDERADPLARIRNVLTVRYIDDGVPPDWYDGAVDGRLVLTHRIAAMGAVGAPADEPMLAAFADANAAGPWWPRKDVAVVCDPPIGLHAELVDGSVYRLHNADGPAVEWAGGYLVYQYHGVTVPAELVRSGWHGSAVFRHPNSEVRRAGIERIGWTRYIAEAGWRLVASAPDPGNPPHELHLYEDPSGRDSVRVLVMTNGSPDRSGRPRRYAEAVPAHFDDPLDAAAWQYGCPARVYRRLKRRT